MIKEQIKNKLREIKIGRKMKKEKREKEDDKEDVENEKEEEEELFFLLQ